MKSIAGTGFLRLRLSARTLEILELFQEADGQPHLFRLSPVVEGWVEAELARQPQLAAEFAEREARNLARITPRRDTVSATPRDTLQGMVRGTPRDTVRGTVHETIPVTRRAQAK